MLYSAFGTTVSTDLDLGPLPAGKDRSPAVVFRRRRVLSLGAPEAGGSRYESQRRELHSRAFRSGVRVRIGDALQFSLLKNGMIACLETSQTTPEQVRYWFLQKMLPAHLMLRGGVEMLHAGVVEVEGRAVAFTAPSNTGKSTMVRHFLEQGHGLLADEHLVVPHGTTMALPTIPYFRSRREVESLGDLAENFPIFPMPIAAIYVLRPEAADAEVTVERLRGSGAAAALCQRQQFDLSGQGAASVARRLKNFGQMASRLKVSRLHVPRKMERLHEVYAAVRRDIDEI